MQSFPVVALALCLVALTTASPIKTKTIAVHAPTSGAALNPLGAYINTKIHKKANAAAFNAHHAAYLGFSPYAGAGMGVGLHPSYTGGHYGGYAPGYNNYGFQAGYGYGAGPAYGVEYGGGYPAGGYGAGHAVGYGASPYGSYTVKSKGKYVRKSYGSGVPAGYGVGYGSRYGGAHRGGSYRGLTGYGGRGIQQISYNHGFSSLNRLRGYGK